MYCKLAILGLGLVVVTLTSDPSLQVPIPPPRREFRTARDERAGPGNEATRSPHEIFLAILSVLHVCSLHVNTKAIVMPNQSLEGCVAL